MSQYEWVFVVTRTSFGNFQNSNRTILFMGDYLRKDIFHISVNLLIQSASNAFITVHATIQIRLWSPCATTDLVVIFFIIAINFFVKSQVILMSANLKLCMLSMVYSTYFCKVQTNTKLYDES